MTSPTLLLQTALEIAQGANGTDDLPLVAALLRRAVAAAELPQAPEALPAAASSSLPQATAAARPKRAYVRKSGVKRRPKGVASIAEMMTELEITPTHADSVRYGTRVAALYRRHTTIPAPKIGAVKMYPADWLKDAIASITLSGGES